MELTRLLETLNTEFSLSCGLSFQVIDGEAGRYYHATGEIVINPTIPMSEQIFTLFHEFRHAMQFSGNTFAALYGVANNEEATKVQATLSYEEYPEELDANNFAEVFSKAI